MRGEERAERLVRRIENFSDLVIGFSLALLALTLSIPPHIVELATHPWWLIAYFWTFAVICGLWFNHQRLFTHYFWPESATVILNFAFLSTIGLIVFFVQVFVHYHDEFDKTWAFLAYFAAMSLAFLAIGTLYLHGTRKRWDSLDGRERYVGLRQAVRGLAGGVFILAGVAVSTARHPATMTDVFPLAYIALFGMLGSRITMRVMKRRIVGLADA